MKPGQTTPEPKGAKDLQKRKLVQRHEQALLRLGQKLNSITTAEQAGEIIIETADELIGFDSCLFALYSIEDNILHGLVGYDLVDGQRIRIPNTFKEIASPRVHRALRKGGQLVLRRNLKTDSQDSHPFGDKERKSASILDVPIRNAEKVIGMMTIQSYEFDAYSDADLKTLEALAEYCVGALERIRAQEALQENERNFRELAEAIPHMVWTTGPNGESQYCNRRWHEQTGSDAQRETATPQNPFFRDAGWLEPIHPDHRVRVMKEWSASLQTGKIFQTEYLLRRFSDGEYLWHLDRGIPLRDSNGKIIKWFGTCTDIHETKKAEEFTRQLNQELEKRVEERTAALKDANEHLESFCYSVSHDLRAPLRTMRGFAGVLLNDYEGQFEPPAMELLQRISRSAEKMDKLINDLLEYSRIGLIELRLGPVALEGVLQSVLMELRNEIDSKKASIEIARPLPTVLSNSIIIEQIFINLISNALKFVTTTPRIQIRCERREAVVRIFVSDNGIGIPAEHHERIFRVFERLQDPGLYPGTGIGLAIVQKGVERMNGRVGLESKTESGSTFWIELPYCDAAEKNTKEK